MGSISDSAPENAIFRLLDLPPELRNNVYKIALVRHQPLKIRNLRPDDYAYQRDNGHWRARTLYQVSDFRWRNYWPKGARSIGPRLVTYDLARCNDSEDLFVGLLGVNHVVRAEALPLFYGLNRFHFLTLNSLIPFLSDRPLESHKSMSSFIINFSMNTTIHQASKGQWDAFFIQKENWETFAQRIQEVAQFESLHLKELSLSIEASVGDVLGINMNIPINISQWSDECPWWMLLLCRNFRSLDFFGVDYFVNEALWGTIDMDSSRRPGVDFMNQVKGNL